MSGSATMRVPEDVRQETTRLASMRGQSAGDLLAQAWREYIEHHKEEFASDLEQVANILRKGTTQDLAGFISRSSSERAANAAAEARSESD